MEFQLTSYARLVAHASGELKWDECETSGTAPITLKLLKSGFMHISSGFRELEVVSVATNGEDMRAVFRDKHLLFLQRFSGSFRRFRVKFASRKQASTCVRELGKLFPVKGCEEAELTGARPDGKLRSQGDVSISDIAKAAVNPDESQLPSVYTTPVELTSEEVEEAVRGHLMDPTFHGFVETVSQLLKQMTSS